MTIAHIREQIETLRAARGWSKSEVDRRARLPRGYTSRITNGHRETLTQGIIQRIASAFGIEVKELTGDVEPAAPVIKSSGLEVALAYHQGRWSAATVAAARAMGVDFEPQAWASKLDVIEETIQRARS